MTLISLLNEQTLWAKGEEEQEDLEWHGTEGSEYILNGWSSDSRV